MHGAYSMTVRERGLKTVWRRSGLRRCGYPAAADKMNQRIIVVFFSTLALTLHPSANGLETGHAAPDCSLTPVGNEQRYDMHQFRGKVLYVDFWASWCFPCARSFSFMNELDSELRNRGLQILAINLDENSDDAKNFLAKHPTRFSVAFDAGGRCPQDFGVKAMPSSYLVDRKGIIRHVHLGFRPGEAEKLRVFVEQLLAESSQGH
jgi:peroxiredoxin